MQMLYHSDSFVVVQFDLAHEDVPREPAPTDETAASRGGFEIVEKTAGKEIFIEGLLADRFRQGVQALMARGDASEETFDDYIAGFAGLAQQPVVLH